MRLFRKSPKVSCPKCKALHEINAENTCPVCGAKYHLPENITSKYSEKKESKENVIAKAASDLRIKCAKLFGKFSSLSARKKHLIKLSSALLAVFAVFLVVVLLLFRDREPLLYKTQDPVNQPLFYYTADDKLACLFENGKNIEIGTGLLRDYMSSANGKCVYLSFSGALSGEAASTPSNYVLKISNYKTIHTVCNNADFVPTMLMGGDGEYLYILMREKPNSDLSALYLSKNGKEPALISTEVKDVAVSPNGRHALFSANDNGATKLVEYTASSGKLSNPGIKNSYPLSVDNKGEYLVYAKKTDETQLKIVCEKSTSERHEIPILPETTLESITFAADRRSFSIEYSDRTTYCTCGEKDYFTVLTYNGSYFGKSNDTTAHLNILTFAGIPAVNSSAEASLLPYFFFDKDRAGIYCVHSDASKIPVFDRTFSEVKVSESGHVAFVSEGKLYSGKLDHRSNEICELMKFEGKTLVDISPDGKKICYRDEDGNIFTVKYGKKNDTPSKVFVDPDFVRFSSDGKTLLVSSDNVTSFIKGGKITNLCEGLLPEESYVVNGDLSKIIFVKNEYESGTPTGTKGLYIYSGGKARRISDNVKELVLPNYKRIDRTLSYYIDIFTPVFAHDGTIAQ